MYQDSTNGSLGKAALGDLVTLPDGDVSTARCIVDLPTKIGTMERFIICGEMKTLLSVPISTISTIVGVYHPVKTYKDALDKAEVLCKGAAAYLAPHLELREGGLGEIFWYVISVPWSLDPAVITVRSGEEYILWVRSSEITEGSVEVMHMSVGQERADIKTVTREAAVVMPHQVPDIADIPTPAPQEAPLRKEAPVRTR